MAFTSERTDKRQPHGMSDLYFCGKTAFALWFASADGHRSGER